MSENGPSFSEHDLKNFFREVEDYANTGQDTLERYMHLPSEFQSRIHEGMTQYSKNRAPVLEELRGIVDNEGEKKLPISGLTKYVQAELDDLEKFEELFESNLPEGWKEARQVLTTAHEAVINLSHKPSHDGVTVFITKDGDEKKYSLEKPQGEYEKFTFKDQHHWVGINMLLHPTQIFKAAQEEDLKGVSSVVDYISTTPIHTGKLKEGEREIVLEYLRGKKAEIEDSDDPHFKIFDSYQRKIGAVPTFDDIELTRRSTHVIRRNGIKKTNQRLRRGNQNPPN